MAKIIYSELALDHLGRAFEFLAEKAPQSAPGAVAAITSGVEILAKHPLIGRESQGGLRELIVSYGKTGYVALYWFAEERDEIWVLAIRHQRELDYPD